MFKKFEWINYIDCFIESAKNCRNRNDIDIEFETKAFQVCDKDGDKALDWREVENCEVN